ncbi:hypothetical protein J7438_09545 [Thalassotalea sp. G20_0]|nr:hypothetical protein [Thalassotalea sp. G20_0]
MRYGIKQGRERSLSNEELHQMWHHLESGKETWSPLYGLLLRFCFVCFDNRPGQLNDIKWSDIDFSQQTLRFIYTKGKNAIPKKRIVLLTDRALAILEQAQRISGSFDGPFIITGGSPIDIRNLGRFVGAYNDWLQNNAMAKGKQPPERFTAKDLRRTATRLFTDCRVLKEHRYLLQSREDGSVESKHYDHDDRLPDKRDVAKIYDNYLDVDQQGWHPKSGQKDKYGNLIEDRIYNQKDMDRDIVFDERTQLVAFKVTEYLQKTGEFQKTIVFCTDIDHAERMRQALVNLNPERVKENRKYIMGITGDNDEGKAELDNFIDPESRYPTIVTTSQLMSTGVDAKTCKLIVLDKTIGSPTEFKQIIGRGTRIDEEHNKHWFTIMDFKKATERFADKDFDGDPVQIFKPKEGDDIVPPDDNPPDDTDTTPDNIDDIGEDDSIEDGEEWGNDDTDEEDTPTPPPPGEEGEPEPRIKYHVQGQEFKISRERVQHLDANGKLVIESMHDHTRECVTRQYASLDDFLRKWSSSDKKKAVIDELAEQGVFWPELQANVSKELGTELDPFDLICHVAFDQPPLTRRERADNMKKRNYFTRYEAAARQVLETLLEKYADVGIEPVEEMTILTDQAFSKIGAPMELVSAFGGKSGYLQAVQELEALLYSKPQSARFLPSPLLQWRPG